MKALTKAQVIDLMRKIHADGIDNSKYAIQVSVKETSSCALFGGEDDRTLQPGAYLALYSDDFEFSEFPFTSKWVDKELTEDNIEISFNGDGEILVICLELL